MDKRIIYFLLVAIVIALISGVFYYALPDRNGFSVDNIILKFSVKENESVSKQIIIKNGQKDGSFMIEHQLAFLTVDQTSFDLAAGATKTFTIFLNATNRPSGTYAGTLFVKKNNEVLEIPVIFEVESQELLFDGLIHVAPEYSDAHTGGKLIVENKIFNLENIGKKTIDVTYQVRDFKGQTLFEESEKIIIENQVLSTKVISLPKDIETGKYLYSITTTYLDSVGVSSYVFDVSSGSFVDRNDFIFWFGGILLLIFIFFLFYNFHERDRFFLELEQQHKKELHVIMKKLDERERRIRTLPASRRAAQVRHITVVKKILIKKANAIYKKRKKIITHLKRQNKKTQITDKLRLWKKQGYAVDEFFKGGSGLSRSGSYKKEGYKL